VRSGFQNHGKKAGAVPTGRADIDGQFANLYCRTKLKSATARPIPRKKCTPQIFDVRDETGWMMKELFVSKNSVVLRQAASELQHLRPRPAIPGD
jgi:hypothetical protein